MISKLANRIMLLLVNKIEIHNFMFSIMSRRIAKNSQAAN